MKGRMLIQIQENPPETHYFLYRGQRYPFSMDLFNASSKYFLLNQEKITQSNTVNLIDESFEGDLNFTNESIQNFISYFQRQQIPLTNENAVSLNYLAKKYELNMLIQITEQYIEDNHNDLALQNILMFQNNESFSTETFEDLIAEHLDLYLNNDQFLSINLPIIFRILSKYQQRQKKTKKSTTEIIDFLFVCLSKFGREASCLFSLINAGDLSSEKVNYLLTDYSEIFDFHFINSSFLKTIYEIQCDLIKNRKEFEMYKKESNDEINYLKDELNLQKQKEEENSKVMKKQFEIFIEEINKLKETQLQTINKTKQKINKLKNQLNEKEKEISQIKTQFEKFKEEINNLNKSKLQKTIIYIGDILVDDLTKLASDDRYENQIKIDYNTGIRTVFDLRKIVAEKLGFKKTDEIDLISLFILFTSKRGTDPALLSDTEQITEILYEHPKQHILYLIVKGKKEATRGNLRNYAKRAKDLGLALTIDDIQNINARCNGDLDIVISTLEYMSSKKD